MQSEYLNKCYSLLSWQESYNVEEVWAELEKLRAEDGFVNLSISYSNELVLNLIEAVNKDQMIRVIEAYLQGLAVATSKPLEFSINNTYSYLTSEMGRDGKWGKVDRMSQEMYWAGCDVLLGLLVFEVELVCVSNEIDPRKVINDLSLRMKHKNLRDTSFLKSYLTGLLDFEGKSLEETLGKPVSKIHWAKTDQSLTILFEGLKDGLYISNRDYSEIATHFQTQSSDETEFENPINWTQTQRLLILMIKHLMKRGFIPHDSTPWLMISNHFTLKGKAINPRSLKSEFSQIKDEDVEVGGWVELDKLLKTLQYLS
jgi:hypothetical protein